MKLLEVLALGFLVLSLSSCSYNKYLNKSSRGPVCVGVARILERSASSRTHAEVFAIERATEEFDDCMKKRNHGKTLNVPGVYIGENKVVVYNPSNMTSSEAARFGK